jgi:hypothetical protein
MGEPGRQFLDRRLLSDCRHRHPRQLHRHLDRHRLVSIISSNSSLSFMRLFHPRQLHRHLDRHRLVSILSSKSSILF